MDRRAFDERRRIGTLKAAINMYGERILENTTSSLKKSQIDSLEKSSSRTKELHMAKRDMARYRESRKVADSVKTRAESELSNATKTVKDLAFQIEESNLKAKAKMRDVEKLKKKSSRREILSSDDSSTDSHHRYAEMMRELELVKQELSKLKLDMASVLQEKSRAEDEIDSSSSQLLSNLSSADALRKQIELANEEQVLVELARIEALKEIGEIQAQREKEASEFSFEMEKIKKKMEDASEEIDHSKEVESKLAVTLTDVNLLQNELKVVKEIERKVLRNDSLRHSEGSFRKSENFDSPSLSSITEEMEAAKKELSSIKEEGFQFMASMDVIRSELKHVTEETVQMKKKEDKAELTVQNLKSKLLRAKSKLERATAAEEKAKSIVSNLSQTLDQLNKEAEAAKKEKELISEETANIKAEIRKTESEIDTTEERLQSAMQELEAVKASEASALDSLKTVIENAMRTRASASQESSSITISKFEYDYLTGRAVGAEEIADKKVAAAQTWVEALKASEKEILMKIETAHREIKETRMEEEKEVYRTESSLSAKRAVEGEIRNWKQKQQKHSSESENLHKQTSRKSMRSNGNLTPKKTMKGNGNWTPTKRGKNQNSISPAIKTTPGSTPFIIRKKKKVIPDLAKFFSGKRIGKN